MKLSKLLIVGVALLCLVGCGRSPDEVNKLTNATDEIWNDDSGITRYHKYVKVNQDCIKGDFLVEGLKVDSVIYIVHPRWIKYTTIYYSNGDNMWIAPQHWGGEAKMYMYCPKCTRPADSPVRFYINKDLTSEKDELVRCLQK